MGKLIRRDNFDNYHIGVGYWNTTHLTRDQVVEMLKTIQSEYFSLLEPAGLLKITYACTWCQHRS